jgi:hypothetical protein
MLLLVDTRAPGFRIVVPDGNAVRDAQMRHRGGSVTCWQGVVNGVLGISGLKEEAELRQVAVRISAYWTDAYGNLCGEYACRLRGTPIRAFPVVLLVSIDIRHGLTKLRLAQDLRPLPPIARPIRKEH